MRTAITVLLAGALTLGACGGGDDDVTVRDFSRGLVRFQFARLPAIGFCVEAGDVLRADITVADDGTMVLGGAVVEPGVRGRDECLPLVLFSECLVGRTVEPRTLSASEADEVRATFRTVEIATDSAADCGFADPCSVRDFSWTRQVGRDERVTAVTDESCAPFVVDDDADAVTALVTKLVTLR